MSKVGLFAGAVALLLAGSAAGWAGAVVSRPPEQVVAEAAFAEVAAVNGEVSSTLATVVVARWPLRQAAVNQASGTITRVLVKRGEVVKAGDVLYRVDERPVVLAQGKVPAFRNMTSGATGADIQQLTSLLKAKGYLSSTSSTYGPRVVAAVKSWQRRLGVPPTGKIERGDVLFVPSMPMRVVLDPTDFGVGTQLSSGQPAIDRLAASPVFTASFGDAQAKLVSAGLPIRVTSGTHAWAGQLGEPKINQSNETSAPVTATGGDALCGKDCSAIALTGLTQLRAETELQAPVVGVVVPVAALIKNADGTIAVVAGGDGSRLPVTVKAQARGLAVVEGLTVGTQVRVPGQ